MQASPRFLPTGIEVGRRCPKAFHALNDSIFEPSRGYAERGVSACVELQDREFANEEHGYTATKHQREVGAGYFDLVGQAVSGGSSSTLALVGGTEEEQF